MKYLVKTERCRFTIGTPSRLSSQWEILPAFSIVGKGWSIKDQKPEMEAERLLTKKIACERCIGWTYCLRWRECGAAVGGGPRQGRNSTIMHGKKKLIERPPGPTNNALQVINLRQDSNQRSGLEVTTEELKCGSLLSKKPSKILRTKGPVASSSSTQLDTTASHVQCYGFKPPAVLWSSSRRQRQPGRRGKSAKYPTDVRLCPCPTLGLCYGKEPDNIVDWSQPDEIYNPDAPASAAFMRYGLRLSNLEPVEAKHWQERSRYVIGIIYESNGYLLLQGRWWLVHLRYVHENSKPHNFKIRSALQKHTWIDTHLSSRPDRRRGN